MAEVKFFKELTLPGTLQANSLYFIENGNYAEAYLTDSTGVSKMIGNSSMITAVSGSTQEVITAANITARDALGLTANSVVWVVDATADATVNSGGALYLWDNANTAWVKLAEFESMDVVVTWASISGKPSSTVTSIDQAVTDSHTHANKTALDAITAAGSGSIITAAERTDIANNKTASHTHANKTDLDLLSVVSGVLEYNGVEVKSWNSTAW